MLTKANVCQLIESVNPCQRFHHELTGVKIHFHLHSLQETEVREPFCSTYCWASSKNRPCCRYWLTLTVANRAECALRLLTLKLMMTASSLLRRISRHLCLHLWILPTDQPGMKRRRKMTTTMFLESHLFVCRVAGEGETQVHPRDGADASQCQACVYIICSSISIERNIRTPRSTGWVIKKIKNVFQWEKRQNFDVEIVRIIITE